jgi:sec-independent protein translocase protein TatC
VASVDGDPPESWDDGRFVPMSEAEMDAELDRIEAEEADEEAEFERRVAAANAEAVAAGVADSETNAPEVAAPEAEAPAPEPPAAEDRVARVDAKLQRVQELREALDFDGMRRLLYEVLVEGDDSQVSVARNILAQLDEPPA